MNVVRQIAQLAGRVRGKGVTTLTLAALLYAAGAAAHPATERYIPFGYWQSVGATGTYIGTLNNVSGRSLRFSEEGNDMSLRITDRTRIWIDRSHLKQSSRAGSVADLRAGMVVEMKASLSEPGTIDWIKIRADR